MNGGVVRMQVGNISLNTVDSLSIIWFLEDASNKSFKDIIDIKGQTFEVFVEKGNSALIVSVKNVDNYNSSFLNKAYKAAQLFLDKLLFAKSQASYVDHKESTIVCFSNARITNFYIYSTLQLELKVEVEFQVSDIDGNVKLPQIPTIVFFDPLRYYRMSLKANNLVDAYRYLYLSLESALNNYRPIVRSGENKEGEAKWLQNTLSQIESDYNSLTKYKDGLAKYFYINHYKAFRLKIFHSKEDVILPLNDFNSIDLYNGYLDLSTIVDEIFSAIYKLKLKSGAVVSSAMVENMLNTLSYRYIHFSGKDKIEYKLEKGNYNSRIKGNSGIHKVLLKNIDKLDFGEIRFLNNDKATLVSNKIKENIIMENISEITILTDVVFLNKNKFDRKFNESFIIAE